MTTLHTRHSSHIKWQWLLNAHYISWWPSLVRSVVPAVYDISLRPCLVNSVALLFILATDYKWCGNASFLYFAIFILNSLYRNIHRLWHILVDTNTGLDVYTYPQTKKVSSIIKTALLASSDLYCSQYRGNVHFKKGEFWPTSLGITSNNPHRPEFTALITASR